MRIGVLADTHIPDRTLELPEEIFGLFEGVDLILHAGDVCVRAVLDRLEEIAPVFAVRGNRDDKHWRLPDRQIVQAGSWRIGLTHGMRWRAVELPDRLRYLRGDHRFIDQRRSLCRAFAADGVHCIVFGHTHQVCNETQDGVLLFNPGGVTPTPGGGPSSIGMLEIDEAGIIGRILPLSRPPRLLTVEDLFQRTLKRTPVNAERTREGR
jgi:hypothetical protein